MKQEQEGKSKVERLAELNAEKLRLEIRQLDFAWWKRPQHMTALASIIVGLLGMLLAFSSGFFDIRHEALGIETEKLKRTRDSLYLDIEKVKMKTKELENGLASISLIFFAERDSLTTILNSLRTKLAMFDVPVMVSAYSPRNGTGRIEGMNFGNKGSLEFRVYGWSHQLKIVSWESGSIEFLIEDSLAPKLQEWFNLRLKREDGLRHSRSFDSLTGLGILPTSLGPPPPPPKP